MCPNGNGQHPERRQNDRDTSFWLGRLSTGVENLVKGQNAINDTLSGIHKRIDFVEHQHQVDDREVRGLIAVVSTGQAIAKMKLAGIIFIATLAASGLTALAVRLIAGGISP